MSTDLTEQEVPGEIDRLVADDEDRDDLEGIETCAEPGHDEQPAFSARRIFGESAGRLGRRPADRRWHADRRRRHPARQPTAHEERGTQDTCGRIRRVRGGVAVAFTPDGKTAYTTWSASERTP